MYCCLLGEQYFDLLQLKMTVVNLSKRSITLFQLSVAFIFLLKVVLMLIFVFTKSKLFCSEAAFRSGKLNVNNCSLIINMNIFRINQRSFKITFSSNPLFSTFSA